MPKAKPDPNRPRRWQAVIRRLPDDRELVGAEIGVWLAATAVEVLKARPLVVHWCVDAWQAPARDSTYARSPDTIAQQDQRYFDDCFEKTRRALRPFGTRAPILRAWSADAARSFADGSLSYVFIDAEHTYEGVRDDIARWLPKVCPSGWIGGHDYGNLPRFPGVARAVDEAFGSDVELDGDCTWFHWL